MRVFGVVMAVAYAVISVSVFRTMEGRMNDQSEDSTELRESYASGGWIRRASIDATIILLALAWPLLGLLSLTKRREP